MPRKREKAIDAYIGARVRLRRVMLGMSQEALGEHLSLTFQQIQKYEKGVNRISASRLFELARALDVPVQYFFDGLDDPDDAPGFGELHEGRPMMPYLDFVSSGAGVRLDKAFLKIDDDTTRRRLLSAMSELASAASDIKS